MFLNSKKYISKNAQERIAGEGGGAMGEGSQKVPTSSYKIDKFWGCNVQHGDYSS